MPHPNPTQIVPLTPSHNCQRCPRLAQFRHFNQLKAPDAFNAPVPAFGSPGANLLILGLAPGLKGANTTGRPFTGDFAGILLYETLKKYGFGEGHYQAHIDDGYTLKNCRIINAVRCVPPQNKPTTQEIKNCLPFLESEFNELPRLKIILSLGHISHNAVLRSFGLKQAAFKFGHGKTHQITPTLTLIDSYHCSRYNTNTRRLTTPMFEAVFQTINSLLSNK